MPASYLHLKSWSKGFVKEIEGLESSGEFRDQNTEKFSDQMLIYSANVN